MKNRSSTQKKIEDRLTSLEVQVDALSMASRIEQVFNRIAQAEAQIVELQRWRLAHLELHAADERKGQ